MAEVIVIREDWLGRPRSVDRYEEGAQLPETIAREVKVQDRREEVTHQGNGWYTLPTGETVRGKQAVKNAGYELP